MEGLYIEDRAAADDRVSGVVHVVLSVWGKTHFEVLPSVHAMYGGIHADIFGGVSVFTFIFLSFLHWVYRFRSIFFR